MKLKELLDQLNLLLPEEYENSQAVLNFYDSTANIKYSLEDFEEQIKNDDITVSLEFANSNPFKSHIFRFRLYPLPENFTTVWCPNLTINKAFEVKKYKDIFIEIFQEVLAHTKFELVVIDGHRFNNFLTDYNFKKLINNNLESVVYYLNLVPNENRLDKSSFRIRL